MKKVIQKKKPEISKEQAASIQSPGCKSKSLYGANNV